ncbi:hypothetical protein O0L34_g15789 [Tuta absoluta]|nr:hypothetical protein O0L34_g15789 [Tuta absoluta]
MSDRNEANNSPSVAGSGLESVCRNTFEARNISSPAGKEFRGFPKPCVALPRIDISPFLKPDSTPILTENLKPAFIPDRKPQKSILKKPSYDKFNARCFVNILRDDLVKLKDLANKTPNNLNRAGSPSMILKCKICDKDYSSVRKLLNHKNNKHMIIKAKSQKRVCFSDKVTVHELKEYHKCRKCPKIFEDYRALKAHTKSQHKKRKCYICNYCSKKFVDRVFFKVHIKLHCESCGELFTSKSKCMLHKRSVCKILKLHECKTCDCSFFKLMDLKDHSYEHISMCFVCDICKDQCPTKCGIAHHIYYLHSKRIKRRNPCLYITRKLGNESLYLCKFCDESSVDRDLIERHVQQLPDLNNRVMTGYTDYYFCDQCLKKFSTEKIMLQHKWSHFLITPDNSQNRQNNIKNGLKVFYNINEKIPERFKPTVVLERIKIDERLVTSTSSPSKDSILKSLLIAPTNDDGIEFIDVLNDEIDINNIKKPIVDPRSKKTIISKHQCPNCSKYFSSNYCLNRHIETLHSDFENFRCKVCEETFAWPSLLQSHKCIRMPIIEMPFEDARPEIHFDNLHEINLHNLVNANGESVEMTNGFDDLNITESDDYMNTVDFEIPAPICELSEYENMYNSAPKTPSTPMLAPNLQNGQLNPNMNKISVLQNLGYKLVMQEVPIEF